MNRSKPSQDTNGLLSTPISWGGNPQSKARDCRYSHILACLAEGMTSEDIEQEITLVFPQNTGEEWLEFRR